MKVTLAGGLKMGGGGLMLVSGFLDWGTWGAGGSGNAFDFFFRGTVPWVLTVGVGAITFLLITESIAEETLPWAAITLGAAAIATLLILLFMVQPSKGDFDITRGIGSYLGLIASGAALVGGYLGFRDRPLPLDDDDEYDADESEPIRHRRRSHPPLP